MSVSLSLKFVCMNLCMLSLAACASGGSTGPTTDTMLEPEPLLESDNSLTDPRNIVLTNISYQHPAATDSIDETFDLAVAGITVSADASSQAVVYSGAFSAGLNAEQRMHYDVSENTFTFDINITDRIFDGESAPDIILNDTFGKILLTNPIDRGDLTYDVTAVLIAAQTDAFPPALSNLKGDPEQADAFLKGLSNGSSDGADGILFDQIMETAQKLLAQETFVYSDPDTATYQQFKLDGDDDMTVYHSALGMWQDTDANGNLIYGHTVFGYNTPSGDVPVTGTAKYQGVHVGSMWYQNQKVYITGGITSEIDFSENEMTWNMGVKIVDKGLKGETIYLDYDTFEGTGSVNGTMMSGTMQAVDETSLNGTYNGNFFGVTGEEIGGTYHFTNDEVAGAGSFVAADETRSVTDVQ